MDGIDSRPKTFSEVVGQDHAKRLLTGALRTGKYSRAYLFAGPRSVGKTTLAALFARSLLCSDRDDETCDPCNKCPSCISFLRGNHSAYTEVDAARHGSKERIDSLLEILNYDSRGMRVIYLDEAHMISKAGKDAALKTLESPVDQDNTIFMFSTTENHKMPGTLKSRCVPVPLSLPSAKDVLTKLTRICTANSVSYDSGALRSLAEWSGGHFREAENALEPLILMGGINYDNVSVFTAYDVDSVSSMLVSLDGNLSAALTEAESLCGRFGADNMHSSIIKVLLEALQYGLSGGKRDTFESVKKVHSAYGSKLGPLLAHFTAKGRMTDSRLMQAEIVQVYYKFIKGGFDQAYTSSAQGVISTKPLSTNTTEKLTGSSRLVAQREMKYEARANGSTSVVVDDKISKNWGNLEVPETLELRRS